MSSIYQLQGISTRVLDVGGRGLRSGCIQVDAGLEAEKSMGFIGGAAGR
jgi:hypothetical protein